MTYFFLSFPIFHELTFYIDNLDMKEKSIGLNKNEVFPCANYSQKQ